MSGTIVPTEQSQDDARWDFNADTEHFDEAAYFNGIRTKRTIAYVLDLLFVGMFVLIAAVIGFFFVVASFGLLFHPYGFVLAAIPFLYHTFTVGGRHSATWGMRMMGLRVYNWNGGEVSFGQALLLTIAFYVSVGFTSFLILVISIFNERGRCLHDYLCGVVIANQIEPR